MSRRAGGEHDRLDAEDYSFHTRVREAYLSIAAQEPNRFKVINAEGSINETHARVLDLVVPYLRKLE